METMEVDSTRENDEEIGSEENCDVIEGDGFDISEKTLRHTVEACLKSSCQLRINSQIFISHVQTSNFDIFILSRFLLDWTAYFCKLSIRVPRLFTTPSFLFLFSDVGPNLVAKSLHMKIIIRGFQILLCFYHLNALSYILLNIIPKNTWVRIDKIHTCIFKHPKHESIFISEYQLCPIALKQRKFKIYDEQFGGFS